MKKISYKVLYQLFFKKMSIQVRKVLLIGVVFIFSFIFVSNLTFGSQNNIKVLINNTETISDVKLIDGKPYVDISSLSSVGIKTEWSKSSNVLKITSLSNDDIMPEIIKKVSSGVVGIIGAGSDNSNNPNSSTYSKDIIYGTGAIIKSNGDILTNAHVVKEMEKIIVVLSNGSGYIAKLKCIDEDSDLALLHINKSGLTAVKIGSENEIVTGKAVIAIGTPISFSLRNSASIGVISGVNRCIDSYYKLIQTDASINPGNSGGPLVSMKGNVIGINSSKYSGVGIEGIGFSIPIGTVKYVLSHFEKYGYVKRPFLGADFEEDWAAKLGLPSNNGIVVKSIDPESPAENAGLKVNDMVLSIGNVNVNTIVDYNEGIKSYLPTNKVVFKIKRGDKIQDINVTFG